MKKYDIRKLVILSVFISVTDAILPIRTVVGTRCTFDSDCRSLGNAYCREDSCECQSSFVTSYDGSKCLNIVRTSGDTCEEDIQCQLPGGASSCRANECLLCSSPSLIGYSTCDDPDGCGYHEYHNRCWKTRAVGQRCSSSEECWTQQGYNMTRVCETGVCTCAQNLLYSSIETPGHDRCLPAPNTGNRNKFSGDVWKIMMATVTYALVSKQLF